MRLITNKKYIIFLFGIIIVGGIYLLRGGKLNINTGNKNIDSSRPKIVYQVREVKTIKENGPEEYQTSIYTANIDGTGQEKIYITSDNTNANILEDNTIAIFNSLNNFSQVTVIDKEGTIKRTISLPSDSSNFLISSNDKYFVYSTLEITGENEKSVIRTTLVNDDGSKRIYFAQDFIDKADKNFSQVIPVGFSSDSAKLYLEVWPRARGGDIVDPHGYYVLDLLSGKSEEIAFSGSKELDYKFSEENPSISAFILYPKSNKATMFIGNPSPSKIYSIDLESKNKTLVFDTSIVDGSSLPDIYNIISPDEQHIVLSRDANKFSLLNLESGKLEQDFLETGDFAGWIDDTHVVYENYRRNSWDDQYYVLKVMDIKNRNSNIIYTQKTDHVEGAGLSKPGDSYYNFLGIIK